MYVCMSIGGAFYIYLLYPLSSLVPPLFSRLFFYGFRKSLTYDDLCDLNYGDKSRAVAPKFQMHWDKELRKAGYVNDMIW